MMGSSWQIGRWPSTPDSLRLQLTPGVIVAAISPRSKIKENAWIIVHGPRFSYLHGYTIYRGADSVMKPVVSPYCDLVNLGSLQWTTGSEKFRCG